MNTTKWSTFFNPYLVVLEKLKKDHLSTWFCVQMHIVSTFLSLSLWKNQKNSTHTNYLLFPQRGKWYIFFSRAFLYNKFISITYAVAAHCALYRAAFYSKFHCFCKPLSMKKEANWLLLSVYIHLWWLHIWREPVRF